MATKHRGVAASLPGRDPRSAPARGERARLESPAFRHKDRLAEHLMAFGNHPGAGTLVFGIDDDGKPIGVGANAVSHIANTLAPRGRTAIEPLLVIDHAAVEYHGVTALPSPNPAGQRVVEARRHGSTPATGRCSRPVSAATSWKPLPDCESGARKSRCGEAIATQARGQTLAAPARHSRRKPTVTQSCGTWLRTMTCSSRASRKVVTGP